MNGLLFLYTGKNISAKVRLKVDKLSFSIYKINPHQANGDIFFSDKLLFDQSETSFGHIQLPFDSSKSSMKKPYSFSEEKVNLPVFQQLCKAIHYYDIHV